MVELDEPAAMAIVASFISTAPVMVSVTMTSPSAATTSRLAVAVTVIVPPSSTMSIGSVETVTSSGMFATFTGNVTVATLVAGWPVMTPEAMVAVAVMVTWAMPASPAVTMTILPLADVLATFIASDSAE